MFPLRLRGGKPLVAVTRDRRYGPSRLRVNDDDDDGNEVRWCVVRRSSGSRNISKREKKQLDSSLLSPSITYVHVSLQFWLNESSMSGASSIGSID